MSIRKRFFLSHAAMIIMPLIVIVFIMLLLQVMLRGEVGWNGSQRFTIQNEKVTESFRKLMKEVSTNQDKFLNSSYLHDISQQIEKENSYLIVRKNGKIYFKSDKLKLISAQNLPGFGSKATSPMGIWIGRQNYSIMQYDFYFKNGEEGTIFLLNSGSTFVKFARVFFPIMFISLILTLILTNALLSYFMSRSILRPVKKLSNAAEKIRKGNLDFTMEMKGTDELNQLVQSFDSMRAQLKESLELREQYENNRKELVANISHDLKTPITSIMGYVEGIQDGVANTPVKQHQYLETIHKKAKYMNELIEELSLYSKLDVKKVPFHFEKVNIQAFIKDYSDDIADDLKEKGIGLNFLPSDLNVNVLIDRNKIIRVFENIIYNSAKHNHHTDGQVDISLIDSGEMVQVSISDNGPGVPNEQLSTVFHRFYRVDEARSTDGSGLGLAIASQIIEAHGGTIWAENNPGGGLKVSFKLKKSEDDIDDKVDIDNRR